MGRMSASDFAKAQAELMASTRDLTQQKRTLNQIMTAEEKANQAVEGSYTQLSQQLELLKKAYKEMGDEAKASDFGRLSERWPCVCSTVLKAVSYTISISSPPMV